MKKTLLHLFILLFISANLTAKKNDKKEAVNEPEYTILLTGASFASPENTWFEIGCEHLNAKPLNRAIGGEAIADTANRMANGELYSEDELDKIDAFVIMQVHEKDVADETQLKAEWTDYELPFKRTNYAAAYDYVIKRYITDCYNQKFNEKSKYYNTFSGKPAVIVLSTNWNDSRVLYNKSIRELSDKWGLPLIEFDEYIGFSKNQLHPVTKEQMSTLFTNGNVQKTHDVTQGWHPETGNDKYIQQRMAAIYVNTMRNVLPLKPLSNN